MVYLFDYFSKILLSYPIRPTIVSLFHDDDAMHKILLHVLFIYWKKKRMPSLYFHHLDSRWQYFFYHIWHCSFHPMLKITPVILLETLHVR